MKKMPRSKRQMKKLHKQYLDGSLLLMANKKIANRLMALAIETFGE